MRQIIIRPMIPASLLRKISRWSVAALLTASVVACSSDNDNSPVTESDPSIPGLLTGAFVDSPVAGLSWATSSGLSGTTNTAGEFQYLENDTVTFSVGSVELGSVIGAGRITPFDLVGYELKGEKLEFKDFAEDILLSNLDDTATKFEQGLNMLIFLQSLDADNNARNGIAFPIKVLEFFSTVLTTVLFNLDTRDFIKAFLGIFLQLVSGDFLDRGADDAPVERDDALQHFLLQQV